MSDAPLYQPSHVKRSRATTAEVERRREALLKIANGGYRYDVSLMVARGFSSLSFLHKAAQEIARRKVPVYIYHLGDFDPSGVNAGENIEQTLRELAPDADIHFERLAVTPEQIDQWGLPTRLTKTTDTRAKNFGDISVELDAIPPESLRQLVENAINRRLPQEELRILQVIEDSERNHLRNLVKGMSGGGDA